jgi:hypothetical protein
MVEAAEALFYLIALLMMSEALLAPAFTPPWAIRQRSSS